jgi:hypothetical protein
MEVFLAQRLMALFAVCGNHGCLKNSNKHATLPGRFSPGHWATRSKKAGMEPMFMRLFGQGWAETASRYNLENVHVRPR